jgi:alkylhydroperoxidase/carboxymuconolactone decarboxylase family protein YurZ
MLTILGFILDSITMRIYLTELKQTKLKIQEALVMQHMGITIREIAELIGTLVFCCVTIQFGFVYIKL